MRSRTIGIQYFERYLEARRLITFWLASNSDVQCVLVIQHSLKIASLIILPEDNSLPINGPQGCDHSVFTILVDRMRLETCEILCHSSLSSGCIRTLTGSNHSKPLAESLLPYEGYSRETS